MNAINKLLIPIIGLMLLVGCGETENSSEKKLIGDPIPVSLMELSKEELSSAITASGNWTTNDETILSFKVGGIVSNILVEEGDPIKKGQVLATLNLTEIETGLSQAKLALEKARRDYQRLIRLFEDSVATLEQKQNAETAFEMAKEQLKSVEFNFQYAQIKASQNGFVLRKFVNEGQQVSSGTPVLLTNGAKDNSWVLQVAVSDKNWTLINEGDLAQIELPANANESIEGRVIRKSQAADPATGAFVVEIAPNNPSSLKLASGMFGRAKVFPSVTSDGWEIPYEALLDADGSQGFVFVTKDKEKAIKTAVKIGKISNETVQITAGLEEFPFLIVSGSAYLKDESAIQIK